MAPAGGLMFLRNASVKTEETTDRHLFIHPGLEYLKFWTAWCAMDILVLFGVVEVVIFPLTECETTS